jgi:protein gp37
MSDKTKIEWADATWTPIRARIRPDAVRIAQDKHYSSLITILATRKPNGELRSPPGKVGPHCEHASPGCDRCYSETNNVRCLPGNGTGLPFDRRSRDLVEMFLDQNILEQPLHWKQPRRIFVCSQTDLFADFVPDAFINSMLAVMSLCREHTFLVLTKRAERMANFMSHPDRAEWVDMGALEFGWSSANAEAHWPLPNLRLGISIENQHWADQRQPHLKALADRGWFTWVSLEPQLEPVDMSGYLPWIRHLVQGGESGPGARPFDIDWARQVIAQCREAKVAYYLKQVGARPYVRNRTGPPWPGGATFTIMSMSEPQIYPRQLVGLKSSKGSDAQEWPADLRVRETPA